LENFYRAATYVRQSLFLGHKSGRCRHLWLHLYLILVGHHGVARDFYYQLYLPLSLSLCLTVSLSLSFLLSLSLSLFIFLTLSLFLSLSLSVYLSLSFSLFRSFFLSVCLSLIIFLTLCLFLSLCLSKKSLRFQVLQQNACSCSFKFGDFTFIL
jgi:hypothetical protein